MSVTIVGLLTIILAQFVPVEEVEKVMEAVGIIVSWWGRLRLGDISLMGLRK